MSECLLDFQGGLSAMEMIISGLMQKGPKNKCDENTMYGMYWTFTVEPSAWFL